MSGSVQDNERLQSQIGVSISLARSVVAGWLPPLTEAEKQIAATNAASQSTSAVFRNRRAPRAGLGAKAEKDENGGLSIEEMKIKRNLVQKEKKVQERTRETAASRKKRKHGSRIGEDENSTDEEVPRKGQKKMKSASTHEGFTSRKEKVSHNRGFGR